MSLPALDLDRAVPFLLAEGLVDVAAVVDGDFRLQAAARRHVSLRLERRQGPGYLVKQADPTTEDGPDTLATEAGFYDLCRSTPRLSELARQIPRLQSWDPETQRLVTELLADYESLWQRGGKDPDVGSLDEPVTALGAVLALLHRTFRDPELAAELAANPRLAELSVKAPSILALPRPGIQVLRHLSAAQRQLLAIVQSEDWPSDSLARLRREWRPETLIHGDIRADNVLVPRDEADKTEKPRLVLVDWELIQWGDPAWDLAGALQDLLGFWIRSLPGTPGLSPEERAARAGTPLPRLQPLFRTLRDAYLEAAGISGEEADGLLSRAVELSAARLLQTAYEYGAGQDALSDSAVLALQIATNILRNPASAAVHLYALR